MIYLGRIPEFALHFGDRTVDGAVSKFWAALQRRGHVLQELVTVANAQRPRGAEDRVKLGVGKGQRRHEQPP
jgi:hypothetical protein